MLTCAHSKLSLVSWIFLYFGPFMDRKRVKRSMDLIKSNDVKQGTKMKEVRFTVI